jgi:hypothetical protein
MMLMMLNEGRADTRRVMLLANDSNRRHHRTMAFGIRSRYTFDENDAKWKLFGCHIVTATLILGYVQALYLIVMSAMTIVLLCTNEVRDWPPILNLIPTHRFTPPTRGASSMYPPQYDQTNEMMQLRKQQQLEVRKANSPYQDILNGSTLSVEQLIIDDVSIGDSISGSSRPQQADIIADAHNQIRNLATTLGIHVIVLAMLIYGARSQRRWFMLPHIILAAIMLLTTCLSAFGNAFQHDSAVMSTSLISMCLQILSFFVPFRCFQYMSDRDRAQILATLGSSPPMADERHPWRSRCPRAPRNTQPSASGSDDELDTARPPPPYPHYAVPPTYNNANEPAPPAYDMVAKVHSQTADEAASTTSTVHVINEDDTTSTITTLPSAVHRTQSAHDAVGTPSEQRRKTSA